MKGEIITKDNYPDIYNWLSQNINNYEDNQQHYTLTSDNKINAYCDVRLYNKYVTEFKYHFGYVDGIFNCSYCHSLTSLIGSPLKTKTGFYCGDCINLSSLIGSPKEVGGGFIFSSCKSLTSLIGLPKYVESIYFASNRFSNNPKYEDSYKIYLAMWLELLESVNNEDREEYIKSYKNKVEGNNNYLIIPIEIMKEYGF